MTIDASLVDRAQRGDAQALEELLRRHSAGLFRFCRRLMQGDADAEDIVQEACLKACQKLAGFGGKRHFRAWLYKIAQNLCFDALRARRRWQPLSGGEAAANPPQNNERLERLDRALLGLNPKQRAIVHYTYTMGWSGQEIAAQLEISSSDVRVSLHRAIRKLRERLA